MRTRPAHDLLRAESFVLFMQRGNSLLPFSFCLHRGSCGVITQGLRKTAVVPRPSDPLPPSARPCRWSFHIVLGLGWVVAHMDLPGMNIKHLA